MKMQVQGWLIYVSETNSIAFLPTEKNCISAELLDWQLLTIGQNMQLFTSEFKPKVEFLHNARCYFIQSEDDSLDSWLANVGNQRDLTKLSNSLATADQATKS
jgi:hypothetical protein